MSAELTFLFADIEGSTRKWAAAAGEMAAALAEHDSLVRAEVEDAGGRVFKHTGDGAVAVFTGAMEAVVAAVAIQRQLSAGAVRGDTIGALRVRMGLHSGSAEERDGDYFGPTLNRCARIAGAGHGGQVLLSDVTAGLIRDHLGTEVRLIDVGAHRLKDLPEPDHLFQLAASGLPDDFPLLRTEDAGPILPVPRGSFVGRDDAIDALVGLVEKERLVTLTAVGGAGKTRLALELAHRVTNRFPDGVQLVELAAIADPTLVAQTVALSIGMPGAGGSDEISDLLRYVGAKSMLIVLDNCEHVLDEVAELVDRLLDAPGLVVLATSREPLGIEGERVVAVRSLAVEPAVTLFVDRARAASATFEPDESELLLVADVCRRLDGIPLAIELAAARVRHMSLADIAGLLDDRFRLLTGGRGRAQNRHQTLQATMDWSYGLLDDDEQRLLRRLSVFAGGFGLAAASAIAGTESRRSAVGVLGSLIDKSLVEVDDGAVTRYRLLETVRLYARERLVEAGEATDARTAHAAWFLDWGRDAAAEDAAGAAVRTNEEADNLRAALDWAAEVGDAVLVARLALACGPMWVYQMQATEGLRWLEGAEAQSADAELDLHERVGLRAYPAMLYLSRIDPAPAWAAAEAAIELDAGNGFIERVQADQAKGQILEFVDPPAAVAWFDRLRTEATGDQRATWALFRGSARMMAGDIEGAIADLDQAVAELSDGHWSWGYIFRSVLYHLVGRHEEAVEDAVHAQERRAALWMQDLCVESALAIALAGAGELAEACAHVRIAARLTAERYPHVPTAPGNVLAAAGVVLALGGKPRESARLFAGMLALALHVRWECGAALLRAYRRRLAVELGEKEPIPDVAAVDADGLVAQALADLESIEAGSVSP